MRSQFKLSVCFPTYRLNNGTGVLALITSYGARLVVQGHYATRPYVLVGGFGATGKDQYGHYKGGFHGVVTMFGSVGFFSTRDIGGVKGTLAFETCTYTSKIGFIVLTMGNSFHSKTHFAQGKFSFSNTIMGFKGLNFGRPSCGAKVDTQGRSLKTFTKVLGVRGGGFGIFTLYSGLTKGLLRFKGRNGYFTSFGHYATHCQVGTVCLDHCGLLVFTLRLHRLLTTLHLTGALTSGVLYILHSGSTRFFYFRQSVSYFTRLYKFTSLLYLFGNWVHIQVFGFLGGVFNCVGLSFFLFKVSVTIGSVLTIMVILYNGGSDHQGFVVGVVYKGALFLLGRFRDFGGFFTRFSCRPFYCLLGSFVSGSSDLA